MLINGARKVYNLSTSAYRMLSVMYPRSADNNSLFLPTAGPLLRH